MPKLQWTYFNYTFFFLPPSVASVFITFSFYSFQNNFKSSYNSDLYLPPISRLSCKYCRSLEEEAKNWILK